MKIFKHIINPLKWFSVFLLAIIMSGCGDGDPILGGGGAGTPATADDSIKPRVSLTVPETTDPGPTPGPAANEAITATFTESMDSATLNTTSFTVEDTSSGGLAVTGTVTYIDSSKTVKFDPDSNFVSGNTYTATIAGTGSSPVTDLAGNVLAGNQAALPDSSDYVWTFQPTAQDLTAPTITLTAPADGDTNVVLNSSVNATFDEDMDPETIDATSFTLAPSADLTALETGEVTYDPENRIATFNPSSDLASNTQYTAEVTNATTDLAGNALDVAGGVTNPWVFTTGTGLAQGAIALGSAATFGIMATSAITNTGNSIINGDVSLDPGTSMTGFPPGIVNGEIHINDTVSAQARADLLEAYNEAKDLPPGTTISAGADLGALYPGGIPPGTYTSGSTMLVSTDLVLDAGGDANAVWVFQVGSSLTTSADVSLLNGAQAKNVFWVPTQDATVGVGTTFSGTIVSGRDVTADTGTTINGRILAGATTAGTIALDATEVNVPLP